MTPKRLLQYIPEMADQTGDDKEQLLLLGAVACKLGLTKAAKSIRVAIETMNALPITTTPTKQTWMTYGNQDNSTR